MGRSAAANNNPQETLCLSIPSSPKGETGSVSNVGFVDITGSPSDNTALAAALNGKAASSHTHTIANVTGLQSAIDAKLNASAVSTFALGLLDDTSASDMRTTLGLGSAALSASTAFAAASHTHTIANVSGLQTALDGKAASSHTHTIANVTGLQTALDAKVDGANGSLSNPTVTDFTETTVAPSAGTSFSPDLSTGTSFYYLTSGNCTITLPACAVGKSFTITVQYGGTHSLSWAGGARKWDDGTVPTPTSANGKRDKFAFHCVDGSNWDAVQSMVNY